MDLVGLKLVRWVAGSALRARANQHPNWQTLLLPQLGE